MRCRTQARSSDYGKDAVAQLLVRMANHRDDLIAVGYPTEMDRFPAANPGLRSRFGATITFADHTADELTQLCLVVRKAPGYQLAPDLLAALPGAIAGIDGRADSPTAARSGSWSST